MSISEQRMLREAEELAKKLQKEAFAHLDGILKNLYGILESSDLPDIMRVIVKEIETLRREMERWQEVHVEGSYEE